MSKPKSFDPGNIPAHPIIAALAEVTEQEAVVELAGYVGPSAPDVVRIYNSFQINSYQEMSKSDILHAVEESNSGMVKLYVRASAVIRTVEISSSELPAQEAIERRRFSGNTLERACKILGEAIRILQSLPATPAIEQKLRELKEARDLLRCGHIGYHFHPD